MNYDDNLFINEIKFYIIIIKIDDEIFLYYVS